MGKGPAGAVVVASAFALIAPMKTARGQDPPRDEASPPDTLPEIRIPRYIFALEDTLEIPAFFEMSPLEVRADRLKIGDIVKRCIEREEAIRERIESLEQTVIVKQVYHVGGYGDRAREKWVAEQADRQIFRKPDFEKTVPLKLEKYRVVDGERKEWPEDEDPSVKITYGGLSSLPFYLEDRDQYDFRILSREIVGQRVLYEVQLEPKSDFAIAPEGKIWVDASTFQILREEFDFEDRVPLPMFVKSIGPFIRERVRIGDVWVWKRFLIRVDVRTGLLKMFDRDIPDVVEFVVNFRDFRVNEPAGGPADDGGRANPTPERESGP